MCAGPHSCSPAHRSGGNGRPQCRMHIAAALFALVLLFPLQGHAAEAAGRPAELLEEVTTDVLADLKQLDPAGPGAHARIVDLVVAKVVPVLDLPRMTQIAVGRNWRLATA